MTIVMTRIAVLQLPAAMVGFGRPFLAAIPAGLFLMFRKAPFPPREHLFGLLRVASCGLVAYPLFSALGVRQAPASHGAIVIGLTPIFTALFAALFSHERPSAKFWIAVVVGSAAVTLFALHESGWALRASDAYLALAAITCGLGYAEGARLSRHLGGMVALSWALVLALPFTATAVALTARQGMFQASGASWAAFAYTGLASMFLSMWSWYHGLSKGGIARVGQIQLFQVFLSLLWAHLFLSESVSGSALIAASVVVAAVAVGSQARIAPAPLPAGTLRRAS
jgi:drug/metabolite transporter (DMT)-like permease